MDYALNNDVLIYYLDYDTKLIRPKIIRTSRKGFFKTKIKS